MVSPRRTSRYLAFAVAMPSRKRSYTVVVCGWPFVMTSATGTACRTSTNPPMWSECGWVATIRSRLFTPLSRRYWFAPEPASPPSISATLPSDEVMRIESPCPTSMNATSSWGEALLVVPGGWGTEVADGGILGETGSDDGAGVAEGETTDGKAVLG